MTYLPADYTKVDAAIAKANALNKDNYKNFSAVEDAVNAVVRGKNITEQDEVDAMAQAIEKAINDLVRRSSGGSSSPSYSVTIPNKTENGTVTVNPKSASKGSTVTITAKPDSGYQLDDLSPLCSCTYSLICGYVAPFWNPDISIFSNENSTRTFFESISPLERRTTVSKKLVRSSPVGLGAI